MLFLLLAFISGARGAATESFNLYEKTFARDNIFCDHAGKHVEILLRGAGKFTELNEKAFGEYALFREDDETKVVTLDISNHHLGFYRFYRGKGSLCSKALGFKISPDVLAVLFLKENQPYKGKLLIQPLDVKKFETLPLVQTNLLTDRAEATPEGFNFRGYTERLHLPTGKVTIDSASYIYQEREFPLWLSFTKVGLSYLPSVTFNRLPWRKLFKDEGDFLKASGWDEKEKKFTNTVLFYAVNHQLKRECMLFVSSPLVPAGTEAWRCAQKTQE